MKVRSRTCTAHPRRHRGPDWRTLAAALLWLLLPLNAMAAGVPAPSLSHELNHLDTRVDAPDFTLPDMDGKTHSLSAYRGKVVMLNFWATWCPPCRREIPSMQSIYKDLKNSGFIVLGVNEFEDPDHVFAYTGQLSVFPTFPILFDRDSKVSQTYKVKGLPTTLLIDKHGRIVYRAIGGRDFDHPAVRKIVSDLLKEK